MLKPVLTPEEKYNSEVDFNGARVEVLPLYNSVVPGFVNKVPILFQFVTGKDPALLREPFSLVVVLDVSGSMEGNRLSNCKTAIKQLIDATDDNDSLSLVTYSDTATTVFEAVRCGDAGARNDMKSKVFELQTQSQTNLYGGLKAGYDLLQQQSTATNKHIFLLSDGHVNVGPLRDTQQILKAVAEWEEKIPILSYGIGEGFNEQLMSPLGQVHRGSHYFYITDAASIEKLVAKGVRSLTGAVARNVHLDVTPLTGGLCFPDYLIDGNMFPLVRERSVIQYLVELEARPEILPGTPASMREADFEVVVPDAECKSAKQLTFEWQVQNFPLLAETRGQIALTVTTDRGFRKQEAPEVRTFLDVKRGCELRRGASSSAEARKECEQALMLFEGRLSHDRFGFAQEWAYKTKTLLKDATMWMGNAASAGAAKHLGVAHAAKSVVEEEEEEEEMDFDLFG